MKTQVCLALYGAAMCVAAAESARPVRIVLPEVADDLRCQVRVGDTVTETKTGRVLEFSCPAGTDTLSCDGSKVEPIDVSVADVCSSQSLNVVAARQVAVISPTRARGSIEWLDLADPQRPRTIANRAVEFNGPVTLPLHQSSARYVTFSRNDASPVTVPAAALSSGRTYQLPPPQRGGELLVVFEPGAVVPRGIRVPTYPTLFTWGLDRVLALPNLRPGHPQIVPVFAGGIAGKEVPITIPPNDTAFLFIPRSPVGAVRLTADPTECQQAASLSIQKVSEIRSTSEPPVVLTDMKACRWEIGGLAPGSYRAFLRGPNGSGGSATFEIAVQEITPATLQLARVRLVGTIRYNGEPLAGATVRMAPSGRPGPPTATTTDAAGKYVARLDEAGEYSVTIVMANGVPMPDLRRLDLKPGLNADAWSLTGGTIRVYVRNAMAGTPVRVYLKSDTSSLQSIVDADRTGTERNGVPFGTYRIHAVQSSGARVLVSQEAKIAQLTAEQRQSEVELTLGVNTSRLVVRTSAGDPVAGAQVSSASGSLLSGMRLRRQETNGPMEVAPGEYSLREYAPGTNVQIILPGDFVPVCRVVPLNQSVPLTAVKGRRIEVEFAREGVSRLSPLLGNVVGANGSDCPLPWTAFMTTPTQAPPGHSRLSVENFPVSGSLHWEILRPARYQRPLTIPDDGPLLLDWPSTSPRR